MRKHVQSPAPRAPPEPPAADLRPSVAKTELRQPYRILVVDDNMDSARLIAPYLRMNG